MKIALINPSTKIRLTDKLEKYIIRAGSRWPHSGVKKIGTIPHYLPLPFFLGYAASLLEKFGHSVFVFDFVALDYSESEMLDEDGGSLLLLLNGQCLRKNSVQCRRSASQ